MSKRIKIRSLFDGEPVLKHLVERQLRFIFFVFALIIVYISLHYAVDQTLVEGRRLERELKSLRAEYATCTAELMFLSKREEVSKRLSAFGSKVQAPVTPPKRVKKEEYRYE